MIRLATGNDSDTRTETLVADVDTLDSWRVVLFNDDDHTFDEVIFQIIKAVRCPRAIAEKHTWEVHTKGRSIVYAGEMFNCIRVSAILEEIALKTEIQTG
ncbi:ATP-dependent Clp protease adaptor ClpS [Chlorobaculum thiosulfatiphilum]|uniref:ATP-dependent Clp protease adaptor ClpS n=1 Tax=Chlorobaculum thiosulfatiphilum TaxID=115852 RepID=A0A5C4S997_CHLTI|nr:ATP-dependent Clp protease adaptor ClpS [Chlorobaculum thiosulfatiphilum]TNJ40110.1 ATP-dependent Clp protease adaptor ClpS [Chlorobaculum thiosulfatiphilum]